MRKFLLGLAAVAFMSTAAFANPMVGGAAMYPSKNIVQNAVNSPINTTLVAAVKAAGLAGTLQGLGPFTVLAPTNAAFAALPKGTVATLLKPENKAKLVKILTCHVIPGRALSTDIISMAKADGGVHKVRTVGGCVLGLSVRGKNVYIRDETGHTARVTIANVLQSNGVIHVINRVLLPKA